MYDPDSDDSDEIQLISKNEKSLNYFLNVIDNIRNRSNICCVDFLYVHDPIFEENQYNYFEKMKNGSLKPKEKKQLLFPKLSSYETSSKDEFNLGPKDYYSIGKILLNYRYKIDERNDTLNVIFNFFGFYNFDETLVHNFVISKLSNMRSIDPLKIG